jgi:protein-disulfide isomerase
LGNEGSITICKDHIYGIVIVALVALLTISVFTNGFGIVPVKSNSTAVSCNPGTGAPNATANGSGNTDQFAGVQELPLTVGSMPVRGQASAPVTWVEFSDFQCPYCARLYTDTDTQIETNYVNSGKVKMYFRTFPLSFHDKAEAAAEAAVCANEQGKFWEMHDKLFTDQGNWASISATDAPATFAGYATALGLDGTKFTSCMSSAKYYNDVQADEQAGEAFGVSGTPGVFLMLPKAKTDFTSLKNVVASSGGAFQLYQDTDDLIVFVAGAYPYSAFSQILDTVTY